MRVAIDVRTVEPHMRGIGLCAYHLLRALAELQAAPDLVLLGTPQSAPYFADIVERGAAEHHLVHYTLGDARWERVEAGRRCRALGVDVYHGPGFAGAWSGAMARVVSVHDLAFRTHPDCYDPAFRRFITETTRRSVAFADRVIANSAHTAEALLEHLGLGPACVATIHQGLDPRYDTDAKPARFETERPLSQHVLLAVGMGQPRKNTLGVLEAVARLPEPLLKQTSLVIVGEGWHVNRAAERCAEDLGLLARIHITGELPPEQLRAAYHRADLLVFPSLHEGFGLPVLEALACGTPVVAGDAGALPEIGGQHVTLVDPTDPAAIAASIAGHLRRATPAKARKAARVHARAFRWARAAEQTLGVYEQAVEAYRARPAIRRRRVGVDARFYGHTHMGTGRYSTELLEHLVLAAPETRFVLFAPPAGAVARRGWEGQVDVALEGQARLLDPSWEDGVLCRAIEGADVDAYVGLAGSLPLADLRCPTAVVAYDLGFEHHADFYAPPLLAYLRGRVPASHRVADRVVAISEFTRDDVARTYGLRDVKLVVATPGAEHLPALARRPCDPPYLLSVSSGGRNKNVLGTLDAFAALLARRPALQHRLRLIGTTPQDVVAHIAQLPPHVHQRIEVLTDIDDEQLAGLMAGADVLVFLSRFEGFGLPVVEAMHAGVPVLTTAAGALPEAVGEAAVIVGVDDVDAVTAALVRLIENPDERARLAEDGRRRAAKFTWHRSGRVVSDVLDQFAPVPPARADRLGLVSTWGVDCGIASYSQSLVRALAESGLAVTVFAEHTEAPVIADASWPEGITVHRCWRRGGPLDGLLSAVLDARVTTLHLQHQGALFPNGPALTGLLWALRGEQVATVVTLHELEHGHSSPAWLMPEQLVVHTQLCREYLHDQVALTTPTTVIPIGIDASTAPPANRALDAPLVLSFGFLHPHKGFDDVVEALPSLVARHPRLTYRVVGARRDTAPDYAQRLRARAAELGVRHALEIEERFLSERELSEEIAAADMVVFPYRRTPLGSSASVGLALGAGKPIVASATPFFADLEGAVLRANNTGELGTLIDRVVCDQAVRTELSTSAKRLARERAWESVAQQHRATYAAAHGSMVTARKQRLEPWVSVHVIAKETDALGLAWYRSCLESLIGYPDELIVVDNGSSPAVLAMVRDVLPRFERHVLIEAPEETRFQNLRNIALEATSEDATHIHWVDTDEIFRPEELPSLREALADPRVTRWATLLVHFMIDPGRVEDRQVKWNIFRRGPAMRWSRGVHEVLEGVPDGRRGFAPVEHLHLGYCRPQWQTFLKWLRYAILEHGTADIYRVETVDDHLLPWLRGARTPDTILDERVPRLSAYRGAWPASCRPWLDAWMRSELRWSEWAETQVDATVWDRWQARLARHRSWSATLEPVIAELGLTERRNGH